MKTLTFIFLAVLAMQNCANKIQDSFPVGISEVYSQYWVAGIKGGGSGTNVFLQLDKELPSNVIIKQLYFQKKVAISNKMTPTQFVFSFVSNVNREKDTELVSDVPAKQNEITPPFALKDNQAIIEYTVNGEKKFFKIQEIQEKEMLAYPSARPQN